MPKVITPNLTPANRARRFYAAEKYLTRLLAGEPPLTSDQRAALAALLTEAVHQ